MRAVSGLPQDSGGPDRLRMARPHPLPHRRNRAGATAGAPQIRVFAAPSPRAGGGMPWEGRSRQAAPFSFQSRLTSC